MMNLKRKRTYKRHKWSLARVKGCQYVKTCVRNGCGAWAVAISRRDWKIVDSWRDEECHAFPERRTA